MSDRARGLLNGVGAVIAVLLLWQALSVLRLLPADAVPGPWAVVLDVSSNFGLYVEHLAATLVSAACGYALGNTIAVCVAIVFALQPAAERLARGFNLIAFSIPPIVLGPLLAISFQGALPQVILAAVGVYFTTMTVTLVGLRQVDPTALDVVRLYGGGRVATLRWIRLRSSLPSVMSGLRAGATTAILGAMLAEFGSGAKGLGSFLLASMSLGQPARVWGIALVTTAASITVFAALSMLAGRISWRPVDTLSVGSSAIDAAQESPPGGLEGLVHPLIPIGAVVAPFLVWQSLPWLLQVSPAVVKTPASLWSYLISDPDAGAARQSLIAAARQTLPMALAGMTLGGLSALGLALASDLWPGLGRILLVPVVFFQSTPLVALTPLIVLALGRGTAATLAIAISVCFFPAFVTLSQAVKATPQAALDIVRLYGGGRRQALRYIVLPYLTAYLFAAGRLIAPAALLGVMTAEWLATGYGLGGLMNEARGNLDYGMIWAVAFLTVMLAIGLHEAIVAAERIAAKRPRPASPVRRAVAAM